jgi:hypothetical protein
MEEEEEGKSRESQSVICCSRYVDEETYVKK